jgi:signal transduction histidine kinase
MKWPFLRNREERGEELEALRVEAARAKALVEDSPELLVVLDAGDRVVAASKRARDLDGIVEGRRVPAGVLGGNGFRKPLRVTYDVDGRRETILYLDPPGEPAEYQELRAGFTAAVSHELRTPLARLLALLETASLPGEDPVALVEQARSEVEQITELIDDVLFLSELETGRVVVALGATKGLPVVREVLDKLREPADRAGVVLRAEGDEDAELPLRPRMLRVVVENLAKNAIRYAGTGATLTVTVRSEELRAADDGAGVSPRDLPRLFERFYRADRVRGAGGTGLGLAVVKHIVGAAGGRVEASGGPGEGLTIRCLFTS